MSAPKFKVGDMVMYVDLPPAGWIPQPRHAGHIGTVQGQIQDLEYWRYPLDTGGQPIEPCLRLIKGGNVETETARETEAM